MVGSAHGRVMDMEIIAGQFAAPTRDERVVLARVHESGGDGHAHHPRRRARHRIRRGSSKPVARVRRPKDLGQCAFRGFVDHVGVGDEIPRQIIEHVKRRHFEHAVKRGDNLTDAEPLTLLQPWHGRCHNVLKRQVRGCWTVCRVGEG